MNNRSSIFTVNKTEKVIRLLIAVGLTTSLIFLLIPHFTTLNNYYNGEYACQKCKVIDFIEYSETTVYQCQLLDDSTAQLVDFRGNNSEIGDTLKLMNINNTYYTTGPFQGGLGGIFIWLGIYTVSMSFTLKLKWFN